MKTVRTAIVSLLAITNGGCSVLSSLFPDKQKQYQYTTEIAPLEVPPDLSLSGMAGAKYNRGAPVASGAGPRDSSPQAVSAEDAESPAGGAKAATLAQNTEDVPLIELPTAFPEAWNDVGRALGRLKVEVSDQNRAEAVYYVYYGGAQKAYEDRGMWGDISDMFSGGGPKALEYRLKLEEHKSAKRTSTDVFLFDDEGQPVRGGQPLELLKKLQQQLNAIYSGKGDSDDSESGG